MKSLLGLTPGELRRLAADGGQPAYRAEQLRHWLHARRAVDFAAMRNLPAAWRGELARAHAARVLVERRHPVDADGLTEKWLYESQAESAEAKAGAAADTNPGFETVLIRERRGLRRTVCLSCMAGCPLGCVFCATGRGGFVRALDAGEIVEQAYRAEAAAREPPRPSDPSAPMPVSGGVTHLVFMGMGEPLLNLDAVLDASRVFTDAGGMGLSGRRITISTVGIPEGLRRLAKAEANYRLAWSLHAPEQKLRAELLPAARTWPLEVLLPEMKRYAEGASRLLMVEYTLIAGVNDGPAEARALVKLLDGFPGRVNLIPFNPVAGYAGRTPSRDAVRAFHQILERGGLSATLRAEKGAAIGAACGQLRAR